MTKTGCRNTKLRQEMELSAHVWGGWEWLGENKIKAKSACKLRLEACTELGKITVNSGHLAMSAQQHWPN